MAWHLVQCDFSKNRSCLVTQWDLKPDAEEGTWVVKVLAEVCTPQGTWRDAAASGVGTAFSQMNQRLGFMVLKVFSNLIDLTNQGVVFWLGVFLLFSFFVVFS